MAPTRESLARSIDSGLPYEAGLLDAVVNQKPAARIYSRVIERCEQCHCYCTGTQFRESTCARTGSEVAGHMTPPKNCPLPLAP